MEAYNEDVTQVGLPRNYRKKQGLLGIVGEKTHWELYKEEELTGNCGKSISQFFDLEKETSSSGHKWNEAQYTETAL